jgi:hypothetical protein
MKWLQIPRVARSLAYGRETWALIPLERTKGATLRPPGLLHAPLDVTHPPVRVQFMSLR